MITTHTAVWALVVLATQPIKPNAITHRVTSHADDLLATLGFVGSFMLPPACIDSVEPRSATGREADMRVGYIDPLAHRIIHIYIWRDPQMWHDTPMWSVLALAPDDINASASVDPGALVSDILTMGIAHIHTLGGLPWIDIRHAPLSLEAMSRPSSWATCRMDDQCDALMPPILPSPGDLPQTVVWRDNDAGRRVALTFDACSTFEVGAYNKPVIDALVSNRIPATLFVGGHWAEMHRQELVALAHNPLFEIANHSYSHPHMTQLPRWQQIQELLWTQRLIFEATGIVPRYFRPPYGEIDDTLIADVASVGMYTVEFDLPAGDADAVNDARLIAWIIGRATSGSIVVLHMNRPGSKTAEVLPEVARQLRARGYVLTTVSELIAADHS